MSTIFIPDYFEAPVGQRALRPRDLARAGFVLEKESMFGEKPNLIYRHRPSHTNSIDACASAVDLAPGAARLTIVTHGALLAADTRPAQHHHMAAR